MSAAKFSPGFTNFTGTTSYDEVIARVTARAKTAAPGQWIIGRGWDQNDWGDTRFPTHETLSAAVAIFFASDIPPHQEMSGITIRAAPLDTSSR